ncbi:chromosome segregation protein SMC [Candidatus Bathyarchaeota archaeon]|nr:MAG: chromosome segregation protein SMC [Candidatus Bathyarchaeota archaeon]
MVIIKRLELSGFKTFAKRTVLTFDKGLNVIVGPNGSGKSNIVDAIQFVLGELSVRSLRVKSFPDLLFNGNSEYPKARRATVTIHLDNSDRKIPIDADEVVISRSVGPDGSSVFKVNGSKYPRNVLVEMLSMASLTGGMNFIHQGTTIRIAEYPPEERRRAVEQIIGIAEYDRKRREAEVQLREAEVNIRVAKGKYEEVRLRVLELERDRNLLLSYQYLSDLSKRFKAVELSVKAKRLEENLKELSEAIERLSAEIKRLEDRRSELEEERRKVQQKYSEYASEVVGKGEDRLVQIQADLGNLNARLAVQRTTLSSLKGNLRSLEAQREEKRRQLDKLQGQVREARKELYRLQKAKEEIRQHLEERRKRIERIDAKIAEIRENLEGNAASLREIEKRIRELERERGQLYIKIKGEREKENGLIGQINSMVDKRRSLEEILANLQQRLEKLKEFREREEKSLKETLEDIERVKAQIKRAEEEIRHAEAIAKKARINVTAFKSKKDLAERLLSEEKAINLIESLASLGAISGVHGRLRKKLRIPAKYKSAVEAAAEGWLQALVVEDLKTVEKCAESLKRAKIGRIKIIPLSEVSKVKPVAKPSIEGIIAPLSSLVDCPAKFKPAVNFILGDTLLAANPKAALKASRQGFRAVTLEGEVFEPGPRLTVGFYREPIDLAEVVPSDKTISSVGETVEAFEKILERKRADLERFRWEITRLEAKKVRHEDTLHFLDSDQETVKSNISRTRKLISEANRKIESLNRKLEKSRTIINEAEGRKARLESQLSKLRSEAEKLRVKVRPETITSLESEKARLEGETVELAKRLHEVETKLSSLASTLETVYLPNAATVRRELDGIVGEIKRKQRALEKVEADIAKLEGEIRELEAERDRLASLMASKRDEYRRFDDALKRIDSEYREINVKLRSLEERMSELKERHLRLQFEQEECLKNLGELGYSEPLKVSEVEVKVSELLAARVEEEKERLLSQLNMNALTLYEPQKRDYKGLSDKINRLEEEKAEILRFIEEVEREKKEAFYSALEKVNQRFAETFAAITGGRGWVQLQNPEDPFSGGLELIAEFPGKPPMPVTALSGGEKSVVAVCYIFALQSLTRTSPFYVFDEVDAHLDPVNTERLAELLARESKRSQMIVISFKEPMASKADRIFGIYAKNGVSYVHTLPAKVAEASRIER